MATKDYGELIEQVALWPEGLGIDVRLIGGQTIQYLPSGLRFDLNQPSFEDKLQRALAKIRRWLFHR